MGPESPWHHGWPVQSSHQVYSVQPCHLTEEPGGHPYLTVSPCLYYCGPPGCQLQCHEVPTRPYPYKGSQKLWRVMTLELWKDLIAQVMKQLGQQLVSQLLHTCSFCLPVYPTRFVQSALGDHAGWQSNCFLMVREFLERFAKGVSCGSHQWHKLLTDFHRQVCSAEEGKWVCWALRGSPGRLFR